VIRIFAVLGRQWFDFLTNLGHFGIFCGRIVRSLDEPSTYLPLLSEEMIKIGNRSIPIITLAAAFTGMVTSVQTAYQFTGFTPLYLVGGVVAESMFLELGPVITALVLSGRVGANIAAELGTMKVTEQIDALETLSINPVAYLVIPKVVAGVIMFPVITIFADAVGLTGGWLVSITTVNLSSYEFFKGVRNFFTPYDVIYGLIKSAFFGVTITLVATYYGFYTEGGAQGVGRATTKSVVIACLMTLILDYLLAELIL